MNSVKPEGMVGALWLTAYEVVKVNHRLSFLYIKHIDTIKDGPDLYYVIRDMEDLSILLSPTKYLKFKTKAHISPNTIRSTAFALIYYLHYLQELHLSVDDVYSMPYDRQYLHFTGFLEWLQNGYHKEENRKRKPNNRTCNDYLRTVFRWFDFLEQQDDTTGVLKIRSKGRRYFGKGTLTSQKTTGSFKGYLREEKCAGRKIEKEDIRTLLGACDNNRDRVLILLLAETGLRIGELLGVRFAEDIDHEKHRIRVTFRSDNENGSRAKYAEERSMLISDETYRIMMCYISEYHLLLRSGYLFVGISSVNAGKPLTVPMVHSIFQRLGRKTGIKASPHMFRHYFAYERYRSGWDIVLISRALGHRKISTTEQYLDITGEELEKSAEEYFRKEKSLIGVSDVL